MSAHNKLSIAYLWISSRLYLALLSVLIIGTAITAVINKAEAAPCFDNVQSAYNYLLTQENAQAQARDHSGVNINSASEGELTSLHGIGSNKAQAIILYREMFGDFKDVDDLSKVKGIGPKTLERNRARLGVRN